MFINYSEILLINGYFMNFNRHYLIIIIAKSFIITIIIIIIMIYCYCFIDLLKYFNFKLEVLASLEAKFIYWNLAPQNEWHLLDLHLFHFFMKFFALLFLKLDRVIWLVNCLINCPNDCHSSIDFWIISADVDLKPISLQLLLKFEDYFR